VRFNADRMFSNCPRYIHRMSVLEYSAYVPREDHEPPVPAWKTDPNFRDHLPKRG